MADIESAPASPLGRPLKARLSAASDNQRAALPALAAAGPDAAATVQSLSATAANLPAAPPQSAPRQIKRKYAEIEDSKSAKQCCTRGDPTAREGVDYQSIPDEEYWRYNRYLDACATEGRTPRSADAWQKKSVQARRNNRSGYDFERRVRIELGAPIGAGSRPVATREGFVPDLPVGEQFGVTDIKNVATLHDSDQLAAFHRLAKERELPFNLIVGPNTSHITGPLLNRVRDTEGTVHCYDPHTKSLTPLDIGPAGFWSK